MNKQKRVNLIVAFLSVVFGLFLLNNGAVIFGLSVLAAGVYLTYKALPAKAGE